AKGCCRREQPSTSTALSPARMAAPLSLACAASQTSPAFAELGGDAVMRDSLLRPHFFSPAFQFTTTLIGLPFPSPAPPPMNLLPSAVTAYWTATGSMLMRV